MTNWDTEKPQGLEKRCVEEPAHVHLSTFNGKCEAEAKAKLGGMTHPAALETQT